MLNLQPLFSIPKPGFAAYHSPRLAGEGLRKTACAFLSGLSLALLWLGLATPSAQAQPSNDTFATAGLIQGEFGSVTNDNTGAVPEPGEPSHAGFRPQNPIWYKWTAPQSGEVEMDTYGSTYVGPTGLGVDQNLLPVDTTNYLDTVLAVYTGPDIAHLTQIAANDDLAPLMQLNFTPVTYVSYFGELPETNSPAMPALFFNSQPVPYFAPFYGPSGVRFNALAGTNYYVALDTKYPVLPNWLKAAGISGALLPTNHPSTGPLVLNWAYHSSGVFRIATEDQDQVSGMPMYRCSSHESSINEEDDRTINEYYTFDPQGVLVTVTRAAGSAGRVLVDYSTMDGTAQSNLDYQPISGTLVFDDFEMSKTILIPLSNLIDQPNDLIFYVNLSNPRLAGLESTNVSPPRLDATFSTVEVMILTLTGNGDDPDEFYQIVCNNGTCSTNAPTHDVFNFPKSHYYLPRDIDTYWNSSVILHVDRFTQRTTVNPTSDSGSDIHYDIDTLLNVSHDCHTWTDGELQDNWFPLSPGSDYSTPTPDSTFAIHGTNSDFGNFNSSYTSCGGGTLPSFGVLSDVTFDFDVTNNVIPELRSDFTISLHRTIQNANYIPGENSVAWITLLFDDANPPAGSVDEFYNPDYGDQMAPNVASFSTDPGNPGTDGEVYDLAVLTNANQTIAVGEFDTYNGAHNINNIVRINPDGSLDTSYNSGSGANGFISSLALMPNGQMIIGGAFSTYNGQNVPHVARINADGSLDASFNFKPTQPINGTVWAVGLQTNGEVFVAGDFLSANGISCPHIALLTTNGTVDTSFNTSANALTALNATVKALAVTPDGHVIIGGVFTNLGSTAAGNLARLNPNGTLDAAFAQKLGSAADDAVYALALDSAGRVLVGGQFQHLNLVSRNRIVRLNVNGSLDTTFNPGTGADDAIFSIKPQPDGTIYVGGQFNTFNGTHRLCFTRLYSNGTVDTGFMDTTYNQFAGLPRLYYLSQDGYSDPHPIIYCSDVDTNENVMIGGLFSRVGGGQVNTNVTYDFADLSATNIYNGDVWPEPKTREGIRIRDNIARLVGGSTPGPGNLGLLYTNYNVNAGGYASVQMLRTNGQLGFGSANFEVVPGLAQAGYDFIYNSGPPYYLGTWNLLTFQANHADAITRQHTDGLYGTNLTPTDMYGDYWQSYTYALANVSLLRDSLNPGNLSAQVQLANPSCEDGFLLGGQNIPVGIALGPSEAPFTIANPEVLTNYLTFSSATYTANESGGSATITIVRTNGFSGSCSVLFSAKNGTAAAGVNFVGVTNQLVVFGPNIATQTVSVPLIDDHIQTPNGYTVNLSLSGISGAVYGLNSAVLNLIDNDGPPGSINFSSATYGTNLSAGAVMLTLTRSGADSGTITLQFATTNGSAISGVNYEGVTNTLVWNNLDFSPRYVTVALTNNGQVGPNLNFQGYINKSTILVNTTNDPAVAGLTNSALVTITNDNSYGALSFSAPSYMFAENGGLATITVVRTSGSAQNATINYSTADGPYATHLGPDPNYVAVNGTLTFAPGVVSQTFTVPILDDDVADPPTSNFYFTVNLSSPNPANVLGFPASAKVYILDAETYTYPAGSPDPSFTPNNGGLNGAVYSLALQTNGEVVIGGAFTSANGATRNYIARLNGDATLDGFFMGSYDGANGPVNSVVVQTDGKILAGGQFTKMDDNIVGYLTRLNNDGSIDTTFNAGSGADSTVYAVEETFVNGNREILVGGSFLNFGGSLHPGLTRLNTDGTLDASFDPSLTINGTVFAIAAYPTNTLDAGKIIVGGSFTMVDNVAYTNIVRLNPDGTLDSTFNPGTGASDVVRALAIQSDGRIVVGGSFTNFDGSSFNHLVRLNTDGSIDSSFAVGLGADDTVSAIAIQPDDRIVLAGSFLHASGVTRSRITRLLASGAVDPDINFGSGADNSIYTVAIQTQPLLNYGMILIGGAFSSFDGSGSPYLARLYGGSITGSGSLQFVTNQFQVQADATNALITIQRIGGTEGNISVTFYTTPSNAVPGLNYQNVTTNLLFPVGETFRSVLVPVSNAPQINPALFVNLLMSNPTPPAQLGFQPFAELEIINVNSYISFTPPYEYLQTVGLAPVNITRQGSTVGTATVQFLTTTNGSAVTNVDYLATNYTVTFAPGESNEVAYVAILNNPNALNQVTVGLLLTNVSNGLLFNPSVTTLAIDSTNDAPGEILFAQTNFTVLANPLGTNATITLLRTNGEHGKIVFHYQTQDGTATAGYKYAATSGSNTFEEFQTIATFNVPILNVSQVTGNEFFNVNIWIDPASSGTIEGPTNATATILDDNVGIHFYTGQEGGIQPGTNILAPVLSTAGNATVFVERVGTSGTNFVNYATVDDTARAGVNYTATSGTLNFTNGEALKSFQVPVLHSTNVTGNLDFLVNLSNVGPAPAQLFAPTISEVIIEDVNPAVCFTNANFYTTKGAVGTNVTITVLNSNVNAGIITVNYATSNGTAQAGVDYVATGGQLVFSNGIQYQSFQVPILTNQNVTSNLSFYINLFNPTPTNTSLLTPSVATVLITNTLAGFSFDAPSYAVRESVVSNFFNVVRSGYTNDTVSVSFTTANGIGTNPPPAIAGVNYFATQGTLTFTNGQTEASFPVGINGGLVVGNTTFYVELASPAGFARVLSSQVPVTIIDDVGEYIQPAGVSIVSNGPPSGILGTNNPNITMLFGLRDAGGSNTVNLTASLLPINGISAVSPPSQNYGALLTGGPSKSMPFTFNLVGSNSQTVVATMQVYDSNSTNTNYITFNLPIGSTTTSFSNTAPIIINDYSNATPYPSVIAVGSLGNVEKITVTTTNLNHTWPSDIDMLLESPSGASTYLMAKSGSSYAVNNVTLTFDDAAVASLPVSSQLTNGTYKPTSYASTPPPFPVPAPAPNPGPSPYYNTNLSVFNGSNPNGLWSLYIIDDTPLNAGVISNGWILNLVASGVVEGSADVGITMTGSSSNVVISNNLSYSITVTNYGPSVGSNVVLSDSLPVGSAYVSASASQGSTATNGAGMLTWTVGTLALQAGASLTLVVQPQTVGEITNTASVAGIPISQGNLANGNASVVTAVAQPAAQLVMTAFSSTPNVLQPPGQSNYTLTVTVTNQGPSVAPATIIVVGLPPAVNPVGVSPASWLSSIVSNASGDTVTFAIPGQFAVGASATVMVTNQPTGSGTLLNSASSSSAILDPLKALSSLPAIKTVVLAPTNAPRLTGITRNGPNLTLKGANGIAGWTCHVLTSTNVAAPFSSWTLVATGTFQADGSVTLPINNTVDPSVRGQFYLIQEP